MWLPLVWGEPAVGGMEGDGFVEPLAPSGARSVGVPGGQGDLMGGAQAGRVLFAEAQVQADGGDVLAATVDDFSHG